MKIENNEIEEFGLEIKAIQEDIKVRVKLSESLITAYRDFETENENGILHKLSSKFENSLDMYLKEDPNAEAILISKIESHLSNLPLPKGVDSANANKFKNDLARLGLETLRVELKVFNINQETKSLSKKNALNEQMLADKILNYADDLKRNVELNRANHQDVKRALADNSLEGLNKAAKLINPNAKNYNENLEQEIDDFMNGGDLIL